MVYMKKLKSYLLFFFVFVSVAAMMSSCDNDDIYSEYTPEEKPDSIKLPFVMDQNHDSVTVVVDGKTNLLMSLINMIKDQDRGM